MCDFRRGLPLWGRANSFVHRLGTRRLLSQRHRNGHSGAFGFLQDSPHLSTMCPKGRLFHNGETRMPHAPRRNCRQQGCRNLAEKGSCYCREHKLEQNRNYNRYERDPETQAFYTSKEWRSVRRYQLEHFPLCAECLKEGRYTPATLVDHIKPIREGGARLDMANLQSLCWSCHSAKSIEEGSRYGRRKSADED